MRPARMSEPQLAALQQVQQWAEHGVYMPFASQARTFYACERKGFLEYRRVEYGNPHNGYALTEAGRAAISRASATPEEK